MSLDGWGRFRPLETQVARPEHPAELPQWLEATSSPTLIGRGLGRSYGDSAIDERGLTVLCTRMNRFLAFDPETGTVTCESGTSFDELIRTFLPRGYFLPVTPGTKFVTVGGAIAADIHGKNHHCDGTFGQFVESIDLLTGTGDLLQCGPNQWQEPFQATLGGMGLTGLILRGRFRLHPVETSKIVVDYHKAEDLDRAFELFNEGDQNYRYSVAWIDCLARRKSLGRSVLMRGNHAARDDLPPNWRTSPLPIPKRKSKTVPFDLPDFVLNPWSVGAFNELYYRMHRHRTEVLTDIEPFFYPLDSLQHWNRLYGRRGFIQYQALFPTESSHRGMIALLEEIARSRQVSFLAVLKRTGPASAGLMSFPEPGHTLALDLPNRGHRLIDLTRRLDRIVLDHGGRLYLAKDALTDDSTLAAMYGDRLQRFRAVKNQLDPDGRFVSAQARRLGLVSGSQGI